MDSYRYTKRFIETELKALNRPIEVTDDMKTIALEEGIDTKQLQVVAMRLSMLIKRHNANVFSSRIIDQIAYQVVKSERNKAEMINDRLTKVQTMIKPLLVPTIDLVSRAKEFDQVVKELPEGKYLFVTQPPSEQSEHHLDLQPEFGQEDQEDQEDNGLVQDDEAQVDQGLDPHKYQEQISRAVERAHQNRDADNMVQDYETIRVKLVQLSQSLQYKYKKLQYVEQLRHKLSITLGIDLEQPETYQQLDNQIPSELNKFQILVDSIRLKVNDNNRRAIREEFQN